MNKFFGKYRGLVEDNLDPQGLGRLQVSSGDVLGDGRKWAMPCLPYANPGLGFLMLPPVGASVWLEFEGGDPNYPIWTGCFWTTAIPPELGRDEVVVSTSGGHRLVLSDAPNEVSLIHSNGSTVKLDAAGTITLEAALVKASGVVQCDTLIANSVVATSYTPGTGNIE
jgi:Type VI secretion system/phage-baseplate injector OB domain